MLGDIRGFQKVGARRYNGLCLGDLIGPSNGNVDRACNQAWINVARSHDTRSVTTIVRLHHWCTCCAYANIRASSGKVKFIGRH